jgi:hypothetical protein
MTETIKSYIPKLAEWLLHTTSKLLSLMYFLPNGEVIIIIIIIIITTTTTTTTCYSTFNMVSPESGDCPKLYLLNKRNDY